MKKTILITGSLAFDYIMDFPEAFADHIIPEKIKTLSISFDLQTLNKNFGGNAGNIAYTLALLGAKTDILSSAGKNDFDSYLTHLKKHAIGTGHIQFIPEESTASAFGITDKNNCQIWGFYPGALMKNIEFSLHDILENDTYHFLVVGPQVADSIEKLTHEARELKLPYFYSPGQEITHLSAEQLKKGIIGAEIVLVNDYELAMITKKTGWERREIAAQTKVFIVTLGAEGSEIEAKHGLTKVGIVKPTEIIDPTGAGDSYVAGFLAGYIRNLPLKTCGQMGATAATYTIEQYGTQVHSFTINEFTKRYSEAFHEKLTL